MNKIYKVIWSKTRNCYVAVSEIAKRNGKSCTSVNCGGKANRTRSLHRAAVTLGVTAALIGGVGFGSPIAWADGSITVDNADIPPESVTYINFGGYYTYYYPNPSINPPIEINIVGGQTSNKHYVGYASASASGTLSGYTLNVSGTDTKIPEALGVYIRGGSLTASGNSVNVSYGASIDGDNGEIAGAKIDKGTAQGNTVTIENSYAKGTVIGGWVTGSGDVKGNRVTISGIKEGKTFTVESDVLGGYVGFTSGSNGDADSNIVTISDAIINGNVYGGKNSSGNITNNQIEISGSSVNSAVYGGFSNNDSVSGNIITIIDSTVGGEVTGGNSGLNETNSKVSGNQVSIGGTDSDNITTISGNVIGGQGGGITNKGNVVGGTAEGEGNTVTISGGTVTGSVFGGESNNGSVIGNKVTIDTTAAGATDVSVQRVYGGKGNGSAEITGNEVSIRGSKTKVNIIVESNTVGVYGVYGGYSSGSGTASKNTVTISNEAEVKCYDVYGGYSVDGDAGGTRADEGNTVTVSDSTLTGFVIGGRSKNGNANYNSVTVNNSSLTSSGKNKFVQGGRAGDASVGDGTANFNTVTINGSTITVSGTSNYASIYGGRSTSGKADSNTVTITGTTITTSGTDTAVSIYGGASDNKTTACDNNTVNLLGASVLDGKGSTNIYGSNETAGTGNELHIGGVKGSTETSSDNIWTNNSSKGTNKVSNVSNFDKIVLHDVAWSPATSTTASTPALHAETVSNVGTLDITNLKFYDGTTEKTTFTVGDKMALLKSDSVLNGLGLAYKDNGTEKSVTSIGTGVTFDATSFTESNAINGVKLTGNEGKMISLVDSNKTIQFSYDSKVTGMTFDTVTWSKDGTARTLTPDEQAKYTFNADTAINASALTFTGTSTVNPLNQSMTLLSGATGITDGHITQPTDAGKGEVAVEYADANGVTLKAKAKGTVSVESSAVKYTINNVMLDSVDLAGWDGTTASAVPAGWTKNGSGISVDMGSTLLDLTTETSVLTSETDGLFTGAVFSGVNGYEDTANNKHAFASNTDNGVTLDGYQIKGIKASDDGKNLVYAVDATKNVTGITFGTMKWEEGRVATADYDFANVGTVTATGLSFIFTDEQKAALSNTSSMALLTNATNLATNKTVTDASRTQQVDYSVANGAALTGTLRGTVSTVANAVNYVANSMTLDNVNLANWDRNTTSDIPAGWTGTNITVNTGAFDVSSFKAGDKIDIFNTRDGITFGAISGARAYSTAAFSNNDEGSTGVMLFGNHYGGVNKSIDGKTLTYYAESMDTTRIVLGNMTWGTTTGRTADDLYIFNNVTFVDASELSFSFTNDQAGALATGSSMTLLSNAKGLAANKTVFYGTEKKDDIISEKTSRSQGIAYYNVNGAAFSGTLTGTVVTEASKGVGTIKFNASSITLDSVNLAGWDGKTSTIPTDWTAKTGGVDVYTGAFTVPSDLAVSESRIIFETSTDGFFNPTVLENWRYKEENFSKDTNNGVTLAGKKYGGVKAEANGDKANANLTFYAFTLDTETIDLGAMAWGKGRDANVIDERYNKGYAYDFRNVGTVTATNLAFTFTDEQKAGLSADSEMTLLSDATNLAADKTVTGTSHTQQVDYSVANGAALSGTLTGTVVTETSAGVGTIKFNASSMTLDSVNLAGWDSKTASAVPAGWTKNGSGVSVDMGSTLLDLTTETSILTSETDGLFTGAVFSGVNGYEDTANNKHAFASNTDNGVTLDGYQIKGIKASDDGKNLVYAVDATKNVTGITFGTMKWEEGRVATADNDFANVATVNASGLAFSFTDEQKAALSDTGSMALLSNATNLAADKTVTGTSHTQQVDYSVANGAALTGTLTGTVSTAAGAVNYAVTGMTLDSVNLAGWDGTTGAIPTGWTANASGTTIETDGMTVPTLNPENHIDILQSTTANFFANAIINGANTYKEAAAFTDNENGITFAGSQSRGVTLNSEKNHLIYVAGTKDVQTATLSGDVNWDTSKASYTNTQYTFSDSSQIVFAEDSMFTSATDPLNQSVTVIEADSTEHAVKGTISGTPGFTLKMNNTSLEAKVTGAASIESGNLKYTVTAVALDKVTVNSVGSDAVPAGWSTATDVQIDTESMTVPADAAYGQPQSIMTSDKPIFDDNNITGSNKYGKTPAAFTDTDSKGTPAVTVAGTQNAGVKASADKKSLLYEVGKKEASTVTLGEVTWAAGTEMLDGSKEEYDYSSVQKVDAGSFVVKYDAPENLDASKGESMTLLKANDTLNAIVNEEKAQAYSYAPVTGVTIDANIIGKLSNYGSAITFTPSANQASKLTFGNVEWKDSGALMTRPANITFAGSDVDTANIGFTNVTSLEANQKMTLVSDFGNKVGTITGTKYTVGAGLEGEGAVSLSGSDLIFTTKTGAKNMAAQEQTHNTVMTMEAGMALLAVGSEHVGNAVEGLGMAANAGADGTSTFASMGGSRSRYETGSHVTANSWNAIVAVGRKNETKKGDLEWGVFGEYGKSSYTLHSDAGKGDGDTHYAGGGLLAKWTNKHDVYTEASMRMGRLSDTASNLLHDAAGNSYGYNVHSNYFGAHVGIGKIIHYKGGKSLDIYGKYFYTKRDGADFASGGNNYSLDSVASSILRVGARYGTTDKKWNWYGGLAYEYEFDGKSEGTVNGMPIRAASVKGSSVRGEIGMRMEATKTNPWKVDISIYGYGGKHRGFGGNIGVAYTF